MNNGYRDRIKLFSANLNADAGGEYILPDSMPDVKRIVHVFTYLKKAECYKEDRSASVEGAVMFDVVYCGDDDKLHLTAYESAFSAKTQANGDGDGLILTVGTPDTSARLSNPRKFSVRCRIPLELSEYGTQDTEPYIEGVEDGNMEYNIKTASSVLISDASETSIPYSADIVIPENLPEPDSIVNVYIIPRLPKTVPSDGTVNVSSTADVIVLYTSEDGGAYSYRTASDISADVECEGIRADSCCTADITVYNKAFELAADGSGAMRKIELDFSYDVKVICRTNMTGEYTADAYSAAYESEVSVIAAEDKTAEPCHTAHYTVNGEIPFQQKGRILMATAECENCTLEFSEGGAYCKGDLNIYMITDDNGELSGASAAMPFRISTDIAVDENAGYELRCSAGMPNVRAENNKLNADAEVYISIVETKTKPIGRVSVIKILDKSLQKSKSTFVLYRPDKSENRWDVAKKFGAPYEEFEKVNPADAKVFVIPGSFN